MSQNETALQEQRIYYYFRASILLKGAISAAELLVGGLLFFFSFATLLSFALAISEVVLPGSVFHLLAAPLNALALEVAALPAVFVALYIFSRGLIKLALIGALLKNKLWAYPNSLVVMGLFFVYQVYEIATKGSVVIVAITLFDLVVMYFIWKEWQIMRAHQKTPSFN